MNILKSLIYALFPTLVISLSAQSQSSEFSGTNAITVAGGSTTSPKYSVVSAGISGEVAFTGNVVAVWDGNSSVSFGSDTNSTGDVQYPFASSGVFNQSVQIPVFSVTSNGAVSAITPTYHGGYKSSGIGFAGGAPEIIIEDPDDGADPATATATVSSGEITGISITYGGSGYENTSSGGTAPKVSVVAGPHLVRIIDEDSNYLGRVFLISDNTIHTVSLDMSRLGTGESTTLSTYLPVGTLCEVVPAPTIGSVLGRSLSDMPANWTSGVPNVTDWVYIWDIDNLGYKPYFFLNAAYEGAGWGQGWYYKLSPNSGLKNHKVIYPDESFIIAKRTSNAVTFEIEGEVPTTDQSLLLPESGNQALLNNPYGADILLAELIPSTAIGTGAGKFRPGTGDSDTNMDLITFLAGSTWYSYYYLSSENPSVTEMRTVSVSRTGSTMSATDFYLGSGGVTNLESCNASGSTSGIVGNDSNYTKITLSTSLSPSGRSIPEAGFTITLSDIQGYLLYDGGTSEANATTGEEVTAAGARGSIVYSDLIGSHEVVASSGSYVVVEKQRDIELKTDEGTPAWNVGSAGTGYSSAATFYCVGGNNGTTDANATGTVNVAGSLVTISVSSAGAGYTSSPAVVSGGGGWRTIGDPSKMGGQVLRASEGIIIKRNSSSGDQAYVGSLNPFN